MPDGEQQLLDPRLDASDCLTPNRSREVAAAGNAHTPFSTWRNEIVEPQHRRRFAIQTKS